MSFISKLKGTKKATEPKPEVAAQAEEQPKAKPAAYKHVPKHATVDAFIGAPAQIGDDDRVRQQHTSRSKRANGDSTSKGSRSLGSRSTHLPSLYECDDVSPLSPTDSCVASSSRPQVSRNNTFDALSPMRKSPLSSSMSSRSSGFSYPTTKRYPDEQSSTHRSYRSSSPPSPEISPRQSPAPTPVVRTQAPPSPQPSMSSATSGFSSVNQPTASTSVSVSLVEEMGNRKYFGHKPREPAAVTAAAAAIATLAVAVDPATTAAAVATLAVAAEEAVAPMLLAPPKKDRLNFMKKQPIAVH